MATPLIVHHTPSPTTYELCDAVIRGARDEEITGVEVVTRPALGAGVCDVLAADGYLLGTPANLGYMSGALKHFFDQVYYPCLEATVNRPYGLWVHGNNDTTGAVRSVEAATTGMKWRRVFGPLTLIGDPTPQDLDRCYELGATVAASLMAD